MVGDRVYSSVVFKLNVKFQHRRLFFFSVLVCWPFCFCCSLLAVSFCGSLLAVLICGSGQSLFL